MVVRSERIRVDFDCYGFGFTLFKLFGLGKTAKNFVRLFDSAVIRSRDVNLNNFFARDFFRGNIRRFNRKTNLFRRDEFISEFVFIDYFATEIGIRKPVTERIDYTFFVPFLAVGKSSRFIVAVSYVNTFFIAYEITLFRR